MKALKFGILGLILATTIPAFAEDSTIPNTTRSDSVAPVKPEEKFSPSTTVTRPDQKGSAVTPDSVKPNTEVDCKDLKIRIPAVWKESKRLKQPATLPLTVGLNVPGVRNEIISCNEGLEVKDLAAAPNSAVVTVSQGLDGWIHLSIPTKSVDIVRFFFSPLTKKEVGTWTSVGATFDPSHKNIILVEAKEGTFRSGNGEK